MIHTSITAISNDCNMPSDRMIESGPCGICYYKFNFENKNPVYVLWCDSGDCELPAELSGTVIVTDYLGNEDNIDISQVILTNDPVFVEIE